MWICPNCKHNNESRFDLCSKCASSPDGRVDRSLHALIQWRRRALRLLLVLSVLYVPSYFVLGRYRTGTSFVQSGLTLNNFAYHDRGFPFDPWIYKPIARIEYWIRGKEAQVVIEDGSFRGGQPIYVYGPFE